jgi:catechol 2,3-dioxygenase-like lactoylglutathione lyase family enzyme
MKRVIASLWLMSTLAAGSAWAQPFTPNDAGVTMGHWHLNSRDVEVNKKILVAMGGTASKPDERLQRVTFPGVVAILQLGSAVGPATGGSAGTVVNHVALTVPNVQESVAKWKGAGVPVELGNGRTDQAYVTTPDGLRIEILEDKSQKFPVRSHHVHYWLPEAAIPDIQAWYAKTFGAKPSTRGRNQSVDIPGVNLTFTKTDQPTVPTKGRILDHIGFDVSDLQAFVKKLEAAGIKLDRPYTKQDNGGALAFITDPWGTSIELNERPGSVYIN